MISTQPPCTLLHAENSQESSLERQHHRRWMITFGDLLTLILCFFISYISMVRFDKGNHISQLEPRAMPRVQHSVVGTSLAQETLGEKSRVSQEGAGEVLFLTPEAFVEPRLELLREWARAQKAKSDLRMLQVTLCDAEGELGSVGRALQIEEALRQEAAHQIVIRYAELGLRCAEAQARVGSKWNSDTRAMIQVIGQHG